jgi:hypothetical protein
MRRFARALVPLAILIAVVAIVLGGDSHAELENQVFTSRSDRLRMIVPRNWRATDHPTYPGLLLWMMRTQPPGQIVLSSEAFTRELYCSWPVACRAAIDTPTSKYACALRAKLQAQKFRVGPTQAGPKENQANGIPSVWFEYDDGKHFLRQAIAVTRDRAISLGLSAPAPEARSQHVRPFDQALRTLQILSAAEAAAPAGTPIAIDALAVSSDAAVAGDALADAAPPPVDGTAPDGGVTPPNEIKPAFESAPAPQIDPVGPCPK